MRRPIDTSIEARMRQLDAYRAMTPEHRLRLADEMSNDVRSLTRSGIRARLGGNPTDARVQAELAQIVLRSVAGDAARRRQPIGRR